MDNKLENALENCITLIRNREEGIDDCLARYPNLRKSLEPLLRAALAVDEVLPEISPSMEFKKSFGAKLDAMVEDKRKKFVLPRKASRKRIPPCVSAAATKCFNNGVCNCLYLCCLRCGNDGCIRQQSSRQLTLPGKESS